MTATWTWNDFFQSLFGLLQWALAIVSVGATVALFTWIAVLIVRKDKAK